VPVSQVEHGVDAHDDLIGLILKRNGRVASLTACALGPRSG
jgi:hypothetical protein